MGGERSRSCGAATACWVCHPCGKCWLCQVAALRAQSQRGAVLGTLEYERRRGFVWCSDGWLCQAAALGAGSQRVAFFPPRVAF